MCGIIGYVGNDKHALKKTINCLEKLEYRGYDSSGIAFINNNSVSIIKEKGRIDNLKKLINFETKTTIAIAHTRWATHGDANSNNAHPHKVGKITLVHNGIIENYLDLKKDLEKENYTFKSDTDSEIICAVIDSIYNKEKNKIKTLNKLKDILRGSYALAIIFDDDLENIYAIKKDSPLILGIGNNDYFIASDVPAILNYTNKYIVLEDNEVVALGKIIKYIKI